MDQPDTTAYAFEYCSAADAADAVGKEVLKRLACVV